MEVQVPQEIERLSSSAFSKVDVNTYKTRGEPLQLVVSGNQGVWHSLKGGINRQVAHRATQITEVTYETLFNPQTNSWMKLVPPESSDPALEERLRVSATIQRVALQLAGLPHLAKEVVDQQIQMLGREVYGFSSPHLGPSLQYYQKRLATPTEAYKIVGWAKTFFEDIYKLAFDQAVQLYLHYGYWYNDPNPGNIVLHHGEHGVYVVLIDFANKLQKKDSQFSNIPEYKASHRQTMRLRTVQRINDIFAQQCQGMGLSFSPNPLDNLRRSVVVQLTSWANFTQTQPNVGV